MNTKLTSAAALVAGGLAFWLGGPVSAQQETSGKANWLTDGGDPQRTSWQRNETLLSTATVKDMKLLWTLQTDNQPRQMHNLFPPLIVSDVATAGRAARDCRRRRRVGQHLRHRRREGHADLEAPLRQHVHGADRTAAATVRSAPAASPRRRSWRHSRRRASTRSMQSRGTAGCGSSTPPPARSSRRRAVPAAQRQAVRPEPGQQRPLHDDRAGLRRQSESVLRATTSRRRRSAASTLAAAASGRGSARRSARTAPSTPAAATATTTPSSRSTARRSSA